MRLCKFPGCSRKKSSLGYCSTHYAQLRAGKELRPVNNPALLTVEERFWSKVKKTDSCWNWTGSNWRGYGKFGLITGKSPVQAHRLSYAWSIGTDYYQLPRDKEVDHLCHNPSCVRPEHLRLVEHQKNASNVNLRKPRSTAGYRSVRVVDGKYYARFYFNGKSYSGRRRTSPQEAFQDVINMKKELGIPLWN